jgi:hypothetical protein
MGKPSPLVNLERNQKFEDDLVERVAKVIKVLSNLED